MMPTTARISRTGLSSAAKRYLGPLACLILLAICSSQSFASRVVAVDADGAKLELGAYLDMLATADNHRDLAAITSSPLLERFHPVLPGDLYLDMRSQGYWLRFRLHNTSTEAYFPILRLMPIHVQQAVLYEGDSARALRRIDTRQLARDPIGFQLSLPPQQTITYHLYLADQRRVPVSLQLMGIEQLILEHRASVFFNGLAIGSLLIMTLLTLLLTVISRDSDYCWLSVYSATIILTMVSTWGLLPGIDIDRLFPALVAFSMALGAVIALRLPVRSETRGNGLRLALLLIVASNIAAGALAMLIDAGDNSELLTLVTPATLLALTLISLISFLRNHSRLMLYYFLSRLWIGVIVLATVIAQRYDLTRVDTSSALLLLGISIEVLILAILFMLRGHRRQQRTHNQQQLRTFRRGQQLGLQESRTQIRRELRRPTGQLLDMIRLLHNTLLSSSQRDYLDQLQKSTDDIRRTIDSPTDATDETQP